MEQGLFVVPIVELVLCLVVLLNYPAGPVLL
jgi:hypothetical protein